MGIITLPIVQKLLGGYKFIWSYGAEQVMTLTARRVHENSGGLYAEISAEHFYSDGVIGSQNTPLIALRVNLSSKRGRDEIIKRLIDLHIDRQLEEAYSLGGRISWSELIEQVAGEIIKREREGEPGLILEPSEEKAVHPGYYIEPIITKGVPTIMFGDKGVAKTTLLLTILGLVQTGLNENTLDLPVKTICNVGLLDWESTSYLTSFSISKLRKGGAIPHIKLPYLRCEVPLSDDIDRIGNWVVDNSIHLIGIDSLGQAAGSDKFDSGGKTAALGFFRALRQLNVTSLIIAQNSKAEETQKKTIYGSTYFSYYARGIFELKRSGDDVDSSGTMHVALLHNESNYSQRYPPMGFTLNYSDTSIVITRENVNMAEFIAKVNINKMLVEFLKTGAKSVSAIAAELELSDNRTRVALSRAKQKGIIVSLGSGMWGLAVIQ